VFVKKNQYPEDELTEIIEVFLLLSKNKTIITSK
jgi:hypothetical protein